MVQLLPSVVARAGAIGATGDTPTVSLSQYGSRSVATNYGTKTAESTFATVSAYAAWSFAGERDTVDYGTRTVTSSVIGP